MTSRRELSTDPKNIRQRIRRNGGKATRDIELLHKPLDEWDLEELARGRPRGSDGTFRGSAPEWITPTVMTEVRKRLQTLTRQELASHAADAIRTIAMVMNDDREDENGRPITPTKVRLEAATYIADQIIGRPVASVDIGVGASVAELMNGILINAEGEPDRMVIDMVDPPEDRPSHDGLD